LRAGHLFLPLQKPLPAALDRGLAGAVLPPHPRTRCSTSNSRPVTTLAGGKRSTPSSNAGRGTCRPEAGSAATDRRSPQVARSGGDPHTLRRGD
jgi:hypothetical protein